MLKTWRDYFASEQEYQEAWHWYLHWNPTELVDQFESAHMTWPKLVKRWRAMQPPVHIEEW